MKTVCIVCALLVQTSYIAGQALSETPASVTSPTAASPSIAPGIEPPQLIPAPPLPAPTGVNTGPSGVPDLSQLDEAFKQSPANKAAQEYKLHVEWRQLENRTANDEEVVAAKEHAEAARTDLEKRQRLRAYYDTYYRRMRALAQSAEMKAYLEREKTAHIAMLAQPRVRPTPAPTPTPSRRHKPAQ
jgi:hypothetical protein